MVAAVFPWAHSSMRPCPVRSESRKVRSLSWTLPSAPYLVAFTPVGSRTLSCLAAVITSTTYSSCTKLRQVTKVHDNVTYELVHYCIRFNHVGYKDGATLVRKALSDGTERIVRTYGMPSKLSTISKHRPGCCRLCLLYQRCALFILQGAFFFSPPASGTSEHRLCEPMSFGNMHVSVGV